MSVEIFLHAAVALEIRRDELRGLFRVDPELLREMEGTRDDLQAKHDALMDELHGYWNEWDALPEDADEAQRKPVRDKMVGLLNRRSYIRNLVRDVNEVLED